MTRQCGWPRRVASFLLNFCMMGWFRIFLDNDHLEFLGSNKSDFFRLGSNMILTLDILKRRGWTLVN